MLGSDSAGAGTPADNFTRVLFGRRRGHGITCAIFIAHSDSRVKAALTSSAVFSALAKPKERAVIDKAARISAEFAAQSLSLSLTAQTALVGNLIDKLVKKGALSLEQVSDVLTQTADMITAPLDRSPSDLQAIMLKPVHQHADGLRDLAKKMTSPKK
jgi:hypothetical protein